MHQNTGKSSHVFFAVIQSKKMPVAALLKMPKTARISNMQPIESKNRNDVAAIACNALQMVGVCQLPTIAMHKNFIMAF
jgi:hypothetical protein